MYKNADSSSSHSDYDLPAKGNNLTVKKNVSRDKDAEADCVGIMPGGLCDGQVIRWVVIHSHGQYGSSLVLM